MNSTKQISMKEWSNKLKDQVELHFVPSPSLERLYLELTNRCNLSCEMCYRHGWKEPLGDLSEDLLIKIIDETQKFPDLKEIILGGIGEPTMAQTFRSAVAAFAPRFHVTVTSNGTNISDELLDFMIEQGVKHIVFSVDSVDMQAFAALRHDDVQSVLSVTERLVRKKVQGKPTVDWAFIAMKSTLPYLEETVKAAARIGVNRLLVSNLMPMRKDMVEETLYPTLSPEIEGIFNKAFLLGLVKGVEVVLPEIKLKTERHCHFVESQSTVVRWDGSIMPCYRFLHTYDEYVLGRHKIVEARSMGSLNEQSLLDIWTLPEYMSFRYKIREGIYPSCSDCEFVNGCDMVERADVDCIGNVPSCGDCLWARGITFCP